MRVSTLLDPDALGARPRSGAAGREAKRWAQAGRRLLELGHGPQSEVRAFFVPGRLEIVGKHTDYAGGRSLVAATERGFHLAVASRADAALALHDLASGDSARLELDGEPAPVSGHWTSYPRAVVRAARRTFGLPLAGADVVFSSNLPAAAGLSSSSALVIATWLALTASTPLEDSAVHRRRLGRRERLAEYLAAIEGGRPFSGESMPEDVGTRGGSQDHVAILCSRPGRLTQFRYDPARREREIELGRGWTFVVAVSGVRAEKTGAARAGYNRLSDLAAELADRWRRETGGSEPHLGAILAGDATARVTLARLAAREDGRFAPGLLTRRLEHFIAESEEIVPAAGERLAAGDVPGFGALVDRSQDLADRLLDNQTDETRALAASARELGAGAASAFGAGLGGAVWALVESDRAGSFLDAWRRRYLATYPRRRAGARFFTTPAGRAAFEL